MFKNIFLIVVLLTSNSGMAIEATNPYLKTWTHVNGNSAVLELLYIQNDQVTFLKPNGSNWTMPVAKLVADDQEVARQLAETRSMVVTGTKSKSSFLVSIYQDVDLDAVQSRFAKLNEDDPELYSRLNELAEYPIEEYELAVNSEGTVYLQFFLKPGIVADGSVEADLSSFLNPDPLSEVPFKLSQIEQEKEEEAAGMDSPSDLAAESDSFESQSVVDSIEPPMPDDDAEVLEMAIPDNDYTFPEIETFDSVIGNELPMVESSVVSAPMSSAIDCGVVAAPVCAASCNSAVVYGCCESTTTKCCETTTCCTTECCTNSCTPMSDCCGSTRACSQFRRPGILRRILRRLASCQSGCR